MVWWLPSNAAVNSVGPGVRSNPTVVRLWIYLQQNKIKYSGVKAKRMNCWDRRLTAWVGTIRRESTREERVEVFSRPKKQGTNRSGEGGEELAMWPRIWVTTRRQKEKKGEHNKWDGKKKERKKKSTLGIQHMEQNAVTVQIAQP